ncbi:MAG: Ig-like domain-containing protein [Ferruginibacter sp.]
MKTSFLLTAAMILIITTGFSQKTKSINSFSTFPQQLQVQKSLPNGVEENWFNSAVSNIETSEYAFRSFNGNHYAAANTANKLRFDVSPDGYSVKNIAVKNNATAWSLNFTLQQIQRGANFWKPENVSPSFLKNKLTYQNENFDMEFINDKDGLRQNFIIKKKQEGTAALSIDMLLGKNMRYEVREKNKLLCFANDNEQSLKLMYDGLKAWDANGKELYAYMQLGESNILSIKVDDKNAIYPITVDPLNHVPEWETSADGILSSLLPTQQVDAIYGFNVAALGDINGDGYDDIAIGAPGDVDIIGPTTIVGAGAVFVFLGSASGLSTTPSKTLRATTPLANALFGFSIAGGNVSGDSRNDIVVGAPGEAYSTAIATLPFSANVTAGKVYLFRGEDLSSATPSPFLSIFLDGSTYFENGLLGNVSENALFGFSVAVTEDMGNDGLGEIVVGSPGYAELNGLLPAVKSGAAFVFYSTAPSTPVQLTAPSSTILGIPLLDNSGLLFGFSVDGVGDYDQDGHPDIVVGAPAGVTLNLGNLLGGSAYIFNGNGAGVNTTYGTQLTATSSLINTAANLFGYAVKGVRNASGTRDGSILVSAPIGDVLSNLGGGLKLKAGNVDVFVHKATPGTSQLPTQQIPSPRGNSLLTILTGQNIDVSALFGASLDNMLDVNCDGINDIIVGEPLSTGVGLINANAVGGTADIFLGKADGTYDVTPYWSLQNVTSFDVGINAGSLLGYSVAGARHVRGPLQGVRALVGAPGAALDFGSGIFQLGNTIGTLTSFAAGDNGLGKAYMFGFQNCGVVYNPDVNVTYVDVSVPGNANTNDKVPAGSTYGTPVADAGNPSIANLVMFTDGSYTFTASVPGVYLYNVPVCLPGEVGPCTPVQLKITVLSSSATTNPPVANTDIADAHTGVPVIIKSLQNDKCSNDGCTLNASSVTVLSAPKNGIAFINSGNGNITYVSNPGFTGNDTLMYRVCDNGSPALCASAMQIITVNAPTAANTTMAADDYITTIQNSPVSGNVKLNDTDPEGNTQTVTAQSSTITGVGDISIAANGSYTFTPLTGYSGPVDIPYTTCDNGTPSVCANATLHILVKPLIVLPVTLTNFKYLVKDCGVKLYWTTEQETNTKNYVIENSRDNRTWLPVATISAKGNTSVESNYTYAPVNTIKGQNYYRLVIYDNNGKYQYSSVINPIIVCNNAAALTVLPNPFTDRLNINFSAQNTGYAFITISDATGKQMNSLKVAVQAGDNNISLNNLANLSSGLYIITVRTDEKVFTQKLIK